METEVQQGRSKISRNGKVIKITLLGELFLCASQEIGAI